MVEALGFERQSKNISLPEFDIFEPGDDGPSLSFGE